jgi:hypothetical protein
MAHPAPRSGGPDARLMHLTWSCLHRLAIDLESQQQEQQQEQQQQQQQHHHHHHCQENEWILDQRPMMMLKCSMASQTCVQCTRGYGNVCLDTPLHNFITNSCAMIVAYGVELLLHIELGFSERGANVDLMQTISQFYSILPLAILPARCSSKVPC